MWPCKDIDFTWSDIRFSISACIASYVVKRDEHRLDNVSGQSALVCMSVRAAFDLYLTVRKWAPGDECIFVGVNVPDMFRIAESHGLLVYGTDIDPITTQPVLSQLRASINPRTRFIVVSHLFGYRLDLTAVIELANAQGLDVIEDCAQAFAGNSWWGTSGATLSLFSFGPMKTSTALQGAVAIVQETALRESMRLKLESYTTQPAWRYFSRIVRFALLKLATHRFIYGLLVRIVRMLRFDHESLIHASTKSTSASGFQRWLSVRPCGALVRVIERKIFTSESSLKLRVEKGLTLVDAIGQDVPLVLRNQRPNMFWMVPILVNDKDRFKCVLRKEGFDAVSVRLESVTGARTTGALALANAVMLPFSPQMPSSEIQRLQNLVTKLYVSEHQVCRST